MNYGLRSLVERWEVFKKKSHYSQSSAAPALPDGIFRQFSVAEIKTVTNNFHAGSIIGKGPFGPVYKGTIDDGSGTVVVAIKCLHGRSTKSLREFLQNDIQLLCQLRHPHLVSLIGICHDQNQMFVVYEYMSRGSLADNLHRRLAHSPLVWEHRLQICIGAARGLHYLHTGAKYAVIHCDIKSSSILLDDEWCGKLGNFGLSKMGPLSMSKSEIRKMESIIFGTHGYVAPEYALNGELTEKCDIFSFGVVLFEVLCGRKVHDSTLPKNGGDLIDWVIELGREGSIYHAIDPYLKGRIAPECLNKYLEIAFSCIHRDGKERPAMGEVEVMLELAFELQKKADSEMQGTHPHGEWMYEQEASIPVGYSYCYHFNDSFCSKSF